MNMDPVTTRPYIHWSLDRWKLTTLFGLFVLLLVWALFSGDVSGVLALLWLWLTRLLA
jgi:hypothetical protein